MLRRVFLLSSFSLVFGQTLFAKSGSVRTPSAGSTRRARTLITQSSRTGGHIRQRHIGKSVGHLRNRSQRARSNLAKRSASGRRMRTSKSRFDRSTFANDRYAQLALARALDRNSQRIASWSKRAKPGRRLTITTPVDRNSGVIYRGTTGRLVKPDSARFVLVRTGSGFRLLTGYPTAKK